MEKEYYLLDGDERTGPFTYHQLVEKGLDVNTQLSTPFSDKWQYASEMAEFVDYFKVRGIHFPTSDNLANFGRKAAALIIDLIIIMAPLDFIFAKIGLIVVPKTFDKIEMPSQQSAIIITSTFFLTFLLYNTLFDISQWRGSIGKKILNLAVVDINGDTPGFLKVLARNLGALLSLNFFYGLPFLSMLFSEHRQTWYDQLAKTYVVKTN